MLYILHTLLRYFVMDSLWSASWCGRGGLVVVVAMRVTRVSVLDGFCLYSVHDASLPFVLPLIPK